MQQTNKESSNKKQTITPFAEGQEIFKKCGLSETLIRSAKLMWWTQKIERKTIPISQIMSALAFA